MAAARLPQHPRVAAAALARRGADPARAAGRRCRDRHHASCRWTRASIPARCSTSFAVPIGPRDTAGTLHDKLAAAGARRDRRDAASPGARTAGAARSPQPAEGVTYAAKIGNEPKPPSTGGGPRVAIDRQVRAFDPVPGRGHAARRRKRSSLGGAARRRRRPRAPPGTVLAAERRRHRRRLRRGRARRHRVQPAGGRRMGAAAFVADGGSPPARGSTRAGGGAVRRRRR